MKKTILIIIFAIAIVNVSWADRIKIYDRDTNGSINLTTSQIVYDEKEPLLVAKTAHLLSEDIGKVCGHNSAVGTKIADKQVVILGTLDNSKIISNLVKKKKLDVSPIEKGWERYIVKTIDNPMRGVEKALVIVGSDRRGVAYGAFEISEAIGVSPFYWWADIPVKHKEKIFIEADVVSDAPTIRYRGLFINDEDWGLKPWSSRNFEKELGDIGPKTYAKVCELILRMKGNMLAPAMHSCTGAFYSHPESKLVADSFGIIITTSHCEPLLLNNASKFDWDQKIDGDWDYGKNPQGILKRWKNRLGEASQFENLYTMAMRGLHDAGLRGNYTMDERVVLLEKVIKDQRDLLRNYTNKPVTEIPQIFVPYKETMDVYEHGLNVPDDITLVWVDDNYGYMKRVSSPEEQKRCGRAGVYYHTSYLGGPHDYLWLNTTPPVLMYEELKKSYDTGADRYWLLNVGDIKPAELAITTFFNMAWRLDDVNYNNVNHLQADWLKSVFGVDCQSILDEYYRLAWSRKPEFMGWEREWDKKELADILDTEFSFENYNDAQQRLADYQAISDKA